MGCLIGPILDDRLKEKFLKRWKGVLCIHFRVCLTVCTRATEHTFWPRNLICFSKLSFLRFLLTFCPFFPYITLAFFVFKLPVIVFHVGIWYLGWENLVPYDIEDFWHFFENSVFLRLKGFLRFPPTIMFEIRTISFQWSNGSFFPFLKVNFRGPMKWDLWLLI